MAQQDLKPLIPILAPLYPYYPVIFVYSVCISVLSLATPISVQSLVSTFAFGPVFQPIFILSVLLFGLLTLLGVTKSLQYLMVEYLQQKLYANVTAIISHTYQSNSPEGRQKLSEKHNRYFDIVLVYKNLSLLVTDGVSIALQTTLGLILISIYHPIFIVFGLVIFISLIVPFYLFKRTALRTSVDESNSKYDVADYIRELALTNKTADTAEFQAQTSAQIEHFLSNRRRHFRVLFTQNIFYISLYAFLNTMLLALGGYLVISNQLSVGQLVAAEIVVNAILGHFLYAKTYLEAFYDLYAASKKLSPFYEAFYNQNRAHGVERVKQKEILTSIKSITRIYTPKNNRRFVRNFAGATLAIAIFLALVPWQQFSRSYGNVVAFDPNDRVQTITAPLEGIVEKWLVQDGQWVKKGDPIVRVVDNDPDYLIRLEAKRNAAVAKFEAAKEARKTGKLNYIRQQKLVKDGLSSAKEFEQSKIRFKKLQAEEASAVSALAKAEVDLSRQQQQLIVAPRDGQIRHILVGSGTTKVKEGSPLVEFVPESTQTAVELYVNANDFPLVYPGRKVRLQFEGWPAIQFTGWPSVAVGSFGGVVTMVDPSVSANGSFRVLVKPDPDDNNPWPQEQFLRQGTRVMGLINLDQVTIGYELWRQVNGFPKSMPMNALEKQKGDSQ